MNRAVDDTPAGGGTSPSPRLRDRIAAALVELERLHRELESLRQPAAMPLRERVSGGRRGGGPGFDEEASAARTGITGTLACWAGAVADRLPAAPAPAREAGPLAAFLLRHLDALLALPAADEAADEFGAAAAAARGVLRRRGADAVLLGRCPRPGCGSPVEASTAGPRPGGAVRCAAGHDWQVGEWLALRRTLTAPGAHGGPGGPGAPAAARPRTLPTRLAAQAAGVSEATVRKWASRGKLTRYGDFSRAEYDVDELAALAAR
ncbi:hypothetical protein [Kitasatospora sp. NPDC090308]|uniref:hypothetical protein n=1 Tax=Kitasatospora sp. NPDC090308 TaxID=3364082 RepID=UPI00382B2DD3